MRENQATVAFAEQSPQSDPAMRFVLEMSASALEQADFRRAASALASELALKLGCSRVSIGVARHSDHQVLAVSHGLQDKGKYQIHRELADLMDEAADQAQAVTFPESEQLPGSITLAHRAFAQKHALHSVYTLPLYDNAQAFGAIVFEWRTPPRNLELSQLIHLCTLAGPILASKYAADHPWKMWRKGLRQRLARRHNLWFGSAFLVLIALLFGMAFLNTTHKVTADVMVEAEQQRTLVAPLDGFIASAQRRAGDTVAQGEELGSFERRDLELEGERLNSELQQLKREYRSALAGQDRTRTAIFKARMQQTVAQLSLNAEQLKRTRLRSPIAGYVVSGDLSQSIGTPVSRGETLFQIAPLGAYRVILKVDERDIDFVNAQQQGLLVLTGNPDKKLPIRIKRLTPVAVTEEGRNFFRVEAELLEQPALLRPGMTGAAKVHAGQRSYAWLLSHRLVDWARLTTWNFGW